MAGGREPAPAPALVAVDGGGAAQTAAAPSLAVITPGTLEATAHDALVMLIADARSPHTQDAHRRDLADFFAHFCGRDPSPAEVAAVIALDRPQLVRELADYKRDMKARRLAPATINRRLATVRALLRHAHRLGAPCPDPAGLVRDEKVVKVRDTRGPEFAEAVALFDAIDRRTVKGARDYAMLWLLFTNGLRRAELLAADVADLNVKRGRLRIRGKGDGGHYSSKPVTLDGETVEAVVEYLKARSVAVGRPAEAWQQDLAAPLFASCDHRWANRRRLSARGLADVIEVYGFYVIGERLRPHGFRHMAATEALRRTGGDVVRVKQFTRHAKLDTLMAYRDDIADDQGEVTKILADAVRELREQKGNAAEKAGL